MWHYDLAAAERFIYAEDEQWNGSVVMGVTTGARSGPHNQSTFYIKTGHINHQLIQGRINFIHHATETNPSRWRFQAGSVFIPLHTVISKVHSVGDQDRLLSARTEQNQSNLRWHGN